MEKDELARRRWQISSDRARDAGLWTTAQAASEMSVSTAMIKRWKALGLITDRGGGGKGLVSLFDPSEVMTAPSRRRNLRHGWRGRPVTDAERAANRRLDEGIVPSVPHSLPFRAIAWTCGKCGELVSPTSIRRDVPRTMRRHSCDADYLRERRASDPEYRDAQRNRSRRAFDGRQGRSLPSADRRGEPWTGPEIDIAMRDDLTAEQSALALGRTVAGVMWVRRQIALGDSRKEGMLDG